MAHLVPQLDRAVVQSRKGFLYIFERLYDRVASFKCVLAEFQMIGEGLNGFVKANTSPDAASIQEVFVIVFLECCRDFGKPSLGCFPDLICGTPARPFTKLHSVLARERRCA